MNRIKSNESFEIAVDTTFFECETDASEFSLYGLTPGGNQNCGGSHQVKKLLLAKLGPKGWGRVHHFRNYYSSGWGDGSGQPLSPRALDAFFRFLEVASFSSGTPSVFLTDRGGIELCWENVEGKAIQVEFTGTGAEFYKAVTEEEGFVGFDALAELSRKLSD